MFFVFEIFLKKFVNLTMSVYMGYLEPDSDQCHVIFCVHWSIYTKKDFVNSYTTFNEMSMECFLFLWIFFINDY